MEKAQRFLKILDEIKLNAVFKDGVYFYGDITEKKLANARKSLGVPDGEDVFILFDDTAFGSAKKGAVFTNWGIRYKEDGEWAISWEILYNNGYKDCVEKKHYCIVLRSKISAEYLDPKKMEFYCLDVNTDTIKLLVKLGNEVFGNRESVVNSLDHLLGLIDAERTKGENIEDNDKNTAEIKTGAGEDEEVTTQAMKLWEKSLKLINKDKHDEAIRLLNEAINLSPNFRQAYSLRGLAYNAVEEYDEAINDFSNSIRIDPSSKDDYRWRGDAYYGKENYECALADYNEYIKSNHSDDECFAMRGNAYYAMGDYGNAIKDYTKALALKPKEKIYIENLENAENALSMEQNNEDSQEDCIETNENTDEEEMEFYTKCRKCNTTFSIAQDMAEMQTTYQCPNCNEDVDVSFFGVCDTCNAMVGFRHYSTEKALFGIGKAVLEGFLGGDNQLQKSMNFLSGHLFSKTVTAKEWGECPFCDHEYLMCPECFAAVRWPLDSEDDAVIACSNCNTKMKHP